MNKKLYVGNLSYKTTEEELRELFGGVGTVVSAVVITDRMTGRSKGFGFVEFESAEDAAKAVEKFNNYSFMDRNLTVNEARPQGEVVSAAAAVAVVSMIVAAAVPTAVAAATIAGATKINITKFPR